MKLLILTQKVDRKDPFLGFFHRWLVEFAGHFESITVIALGVGAYDLPPNVTVYSLGKERGVSRLELFSRFYRLIWGLREDYRAVFVHMNQEYVLLGGFLWRLLGKKVTLWRNHYAGGVLTDMAVALADKVFCTSKFSYTAKFGKTALMPVGVDTDMFLPQDNRLSRSVLFLGRLTPSKRPHVLLEALKVLERRDISFQASFYGSALPKDKDYRRKLIESAHKMTSTRFFEGVSYEEVPKVFASHEMFVNLSESGMYDKTIFEAASSGCLVLAASQDFASLAGDRFLAPLDPEALAAKIESLLSFSPEEKGSFGRGLRKIAIAKHSLKALGEKLKVELEH